jgi:hypothetical protein
MSARYLTVQTSPKHDETHRATNASGINLPAAGVRGVAKADTPDTAAVPKRPGLADPTQPETEIAPAMGFCRHVHTPRDFGAACVTAITGPASRCAVAPMSVMVTGWPN